jgi:hypothetical protein
MIRRLSVACLLVIAAACSPAPETKTAETEAAAPAPADAAAAPLAPAQLAAPNAPAFAVLYPDARVDGAPTLADGVGGPGGIVAFTVDADPDQVVAFYKQRAEAAGLASVMGMNQGDTRAYGAAGSGESAAALQVVASPAEGGGAAVQLTWSAGR